MHYKKLLLPLLLGFGFLVTGCGGSSSTPSAIVFDSQNATEIAYSAAIFAEASPNIVSAVETSLPSAQVAIDVVTKLAFDRDRHDSNVVLGVVPGAACSVGGSTEFTGTEDANSRSGTITFNNCDEGGLVIDGSFTVSSTWVAIPGEFSNSGNGTITMSFGGQSFTMTLNFTSDGDSSTGDFSNTVSFSMSFPGYGSFSVATTSPITGNIIFTGITTGQLVVTGGQGTRLRITYNSNSTATVELDNGNGIFVFHAVI